MSDWVDREDSGLISDDLGAAYEYFDAAYYRSDSEGMLRANVASTIDALESVLRHLGPPRGPA